ncbi:MAG: hypothetical protein HJJLKODD_01094 [Phycisphaerae bacterium]|nr:hypothetical protein [Phycisphaerae bacterium]
MRATLMSMIGVISLALVGCVSQADYDQVLAMNKSLEAEKVAAEQRALDAENNAESMRNQLRTREGELATEREMNGNLKRENDRMAEMLAQAKGLMDKMDTEPDGPIIIQTALPAELDKALKAFAAAHPNEVEYDAARGAVKWKSDLLFASGSDVVREDAKSTLGGFAEIVNSAAAAGFDVLVVGHTDTDPIIHSKDRHPTNWHLSTHRAIAVGFELLGANVTPARVGVMGYGEYRPLASNDTTEDKARNRRVEIFLVSNKAGVNSQMEQSNTTPSSEVIDETQK